MWETVYQVGMGIMASIGVMVLVGIRADLKDLRNTVDTKQDKTTCKEVREICNDHRKELAHRIASS